MIDRYSEGFAYDAPVIASLGGTLTSTKEVNSTQKLRRARKKRKDKAIEHKDKDMVVKLSI